MNATPFDPGPLAEVDQLVEDGRWTLVFVRRLRHAPEKVWRALTDPAQLAAWAPFTADRNLDGAAEAKLPMIDGGDAADLVATINRAEPPTVLDYTWGEDRLRWDLEPVDGGTRLTLRHTMSGRDWLPKGAAGWHLCLAVADRLLAGTPVPPIRGMAALNYGWSDLNAAYAEKLGIPATPLPQQED